MRRSLEAMGWYCVSGGQRHQCESGHALTAFSLPWRQQEQFFCAQSLVFFQQQRCVRSTTSTSATTISSTDSPQRSNWQNSSHDVTAYPRHDHCHCCGCRACRRDLGCAFAAACRAVALLLWCPVVGRCLVSRSPTVLAVACAALAFLARWALLLLCFLL